MIRRVAFKKAILAGVAGALAWEIALRLLIRLGLPLFDLVRTLGTMVCGGETVFWKWWLMGMLMHALVGAIWAIFYAYFFWSIFDLRPIWQGLFFSLFPALLAGLIMIPQMDFMHASILEGKMPPHGLFAAKAGWGGPAAVFLGHLIYGAILGSVYTKPVGYAAGKGLVSHG